MLDKKHNFPFAKAIAIAINSHNKFRYYPEYEKERIITELHDEMTATSEWIGNPETYARKLLDKRALKYDDVPAYECTPKNYQRDPLNPKDLPIKPRVPVEQMIHPDFREPACYRYERQMPEIRARRAENERLAKEGKSRATEDAPYKGMPLEEMLAAMVATNKEIAKLPEYQDWLHEKSPFKKR